VLHVTAEYIRKEVISPLARLVSELNDAAAQIDDLLKSGLIKAEGLPVKGKMGVDAVKSLRKLRAELLTKIEGAKDGTIERMEAKRLHAQKVRAKQKVATKKKSG